MKINLIIFIIAADQLAKYIVREKNLPVIENSSLPFGFSFPASPIGGPGVLNFWALSAALVLFVVLSWKYFRDSVGTLGWSLVIGGALGNLVDRAVKGTVTDYINLGAGTVNLADIAIYAGIVLLIGKFLISNYSN